MPRPCHATHPPSPASCRLCWLYENRADYRVLWAGPPPAPCRHLGPATGGTVSCPTCRGRVELKLFACAVHGRCTQGKAAPGVACCSGCRDHDAAGPGDADV